MSDFAHTPSPSPETTRGSRLIFALRQAGFMAVTLFVAGMVTNRLRPDEAIDRGILTTSFLWAIVLWVAVLIMNALAFERSQMRQLERVPLWVAAAIAVIVFIVGLVSFDEGTVGRRIVYLAANSLGALLFWWAALSLGYLLTRRPSQPAPS